MFFTRVKFLVTIFIVTILGTFGWQETGNASEPDLEIEQQELFPDEMKFYYRSFTITSAYYPPKKQASIVVPEITWPTNSRIIVSGYGHRAPSCSSCSSNHKGVDFTPGRGTPVYAALDGIISRIEYSGGFGLHVYIDHIVVINTETQYWRTVYAHLQENSIPENLAVGQIIKAGTTIGAVGNTGTSTGPHLHFEIIVNNENVDPEKYLKMYAN
jgi:murein DD-endopeptidase MepM/ murein hydrolase activator NlpD